MGLLFEWDVSVTLGGMSWALWQKESVPFRFWSQLWEGAENRYTLVESQLP